MATRNPTPVGLAAIGIGYGAAATAIVGMICPPALLAIPVAGAVMAGRAASRRHTRRVEADKAAADMEKSWARWSQLDPTSERGY